MTDCKAASIVVPRHAFARCDYAPQAPSNAMKQQCSCNPSGIFLLMVARLKFVSHGRKATTKLDFLKRSTGGDHARLVGTGLGALVGDAICVRPTSRQQRKGAVAWRCVARRPGAPRDDRGIW